MKKLLTITLILIVFIGSIGAVTKTAIKPEELMKVITDDIALNFSGYFISEAFKVNSNGIISYEVKLKRESSDLTVYYNDSGKFIKKEVPAKVRQIPTGKLHSSSLNQSKS